MAFARDFQPSGDEWVFQNRGHLADIILNHTKPKKHLKFVFYLTGTSRPLRHYTPNSINRRQLDRTPSAPPSHRSVRISRETQEAPVRRASSATRGTPGSPNWTPHSNWGYNDDARSVTREVTGSRQPGRPGKPSVQPMTSELQKLKDEKRAAYINLRARWKCTYTGYQVRQGGPDGSDASCYFTGGGSNPVHYRLMQPVLLKWAAEIARGETDINQPTLKTSNNRSRTNLTSG